MNIFKLIEKELDEVIYLLNNNPWNYNYLFELSLIRDKFTINYLKVIDEDIGESLNIINDIIKKLIKRNISYLHNKINSTPFLNKISESIIDENDYKLLKIYILYKKPFQLFNNKKIIREVSPDFQAIYNEYIFSPPPFFENIGESELFLIYQKRILVEFYEYSTHANKHFFIQMLISYFEISSVIPLYFSNSSLVDFMRPRAELIEYLIPILNGFEGTNYDKFSNNKSIKIKIGVLAAHFKDQTETYATLPVYEYLDKNKYHITLISQHKFQNSHLEVKCVASADSILELSGILKQDVEEIRLLNLDIIWIGTNITAVVNYIAQLSIFRLAKKQLISGCCPITSGFKNIDYFISGNLTENTNAQNDYVEKLYKIDGPAHCFSIDQSTNVSISKSTKFENNIFKFVSGANFFKLTPELLDVWIKILKLNKNSILILYPFNPNWSSNYPIPHFLMYISELLYKNNLSNDRIVIHPPFENKDEVIEFISKCDVYLDSFPYSGMTSIIDPLAAGLPIIAKKGIFQRERMSSAALESLDLIDWIVDSNEEYINKAVYISSSFRGVNKMKEELQLKSINTPVFLNSKIYAEQLNICFENILNSNSP